MIFRKNKTTEPAPAAEAVSAEDLDRQLGEERAAEGVRRTHDLARTAGEAGHKRDRKDLAARTQVEDLARQQDVESALADAELARLYREAITAGERLRLKSEMARSGEARALVLEWLRRTNLKVLAPVLGGFAVWSTAGVQDGAARLMGVTGGPVWWALWLLEPVLITFVAWVIIARAKLASSGGQMVPAAESLAIAFLLTSAVLNLISGLPKEAPANGAAMFAAAGAMLAHLVGPIGAAATAHLIGVIDDSISAADPWTDAKTGKPVPRLSQMDLKPPTITFTASALESAPEGAPETGPESTFESAPEIAAPVRPATRWVGAEGRQVLAIVPRTAPAKPARKQARTASDQDGEHRSGAPAKTRPNKGQPVPNAAKDAPEPSSRQQSDEELAALLNEKRDIGELPAEPSKRAVKSALGIGWDRIDRVLELANSQREPARPLALVGGAPATK